MIKNGDAGNNTIFGTIVADYLSGRAGNDYLDGGAGDDYLYGGDGLDLMLDGAGQDHLYGQNGDDDFAMANGEIDFVDGGAGLDVISYSFAISGPTVVDFNDSSLNSGAAAGDQLVSIEGFDGSSLTDLVWGDDHLNLFFGSLGNDRYDGRGGQDLYYAPGGSIVVEAFEIAFGTRANALSTAAGIAAPAAGSGVAYFERWLDNNLNGIKDAGEVTKYADVLTSIEYFVGTNGDDTMSGSAADETFSPLRGANTVIGGAGVDTLSYNFLAGPIDGFSTGVTVDLGGGTSSVDQTSSISGIENANGSAWDDMLLGSAGVNLLMGLNGNDALDGREGNDELHGGNGDDILVGGDGKDILIGGDGADVIDGGNGVDTLSYASASNAIAVSLIRGEGLSPIVDGSVRFSPASNGDMILNVENVVGSHYDDIIAGSDGANVIEGRTGNDTINGCAGDDIIYGDLNAGSNVEDYVPEPSLSDTNIIDDCDCDTSQFAGPTPTQSFDDTLFGAEGNDVIYGQMGDDQIAGGIGNDKLQGGEGDDIIEGNDGSDRIDGGLGTDFIAGGNGDDTISGGAGFDIIMGGDGVDTVDYSASPSAVTANLGQFWLNSGGDASSDLLAEIMSQLADGSDPSTVLQSALFLSLLPLIASNGTETAFTLGLPDVTIGVENLIGSAFDDSLTGDSFANTLTGGDGDDTLDGAGGKDRLIGGNGNDFYLIDSSEDLVLETSAAAGTDTVVSSVGYSLGTNVENLQLTGTANINGSGNELANVITGNAGANTLKGGAGADTLIGGDGNDVMNGGADADTMDGGLGDDLYLIDNASDVIFDAGGIDTVTASVSLSLTTSVENLTLTGSANINGSGNDLNNTLIGNAGANTLKGGNGKDSLFGGLSADRLVGGEGADKFYFDTALGGGNIDRISDFSAADDTIYLDQTIFGGLGLGTLASDAFRIGTTALDADDRIIYDSATGQLWYDADGNGAGAAVHFATVTAGSAVTNADFFVVM